VLYAGLILSLQVLLRGLVSQDNSVASTSVNMTQPQSSRASLPRYATK